MLKKKSKTISLYKTILFFISYFRYEQPSGYRPAPLDLSEVFLSSEQEEVVSMLAENNHNIWARERITQGWTYGTQQVWLVWDQLDSADKKCILRNKNSLNSVMIEYYNWTYSEFHFYFKAAFHTKYDLYSTFLYFQGPNDNILM